MNYQIIIPLDEEGNYPIRFMNLGGLTPQVADKLAEAIREMTLEPIIGIVSGIYAHFGNNKKLNEAGVVLNSSFAEIKENIAICRWRNAVNNALKTITGAPNKNAFYPHITLFKYWGDRIHDEEPYKTGEWLHVKYICLRREGDPKDKILAASKVAEYKEPEGLLGIYRQACSNWRGGEQAAQQARIRSAEGSRSAARKHGAFAAKKAAEARVQDGFDYLRVNCWPEGTEQELLEKFKQSGGYGKIPFDGNSFRALTPMPDLGWGDYRPFVGYKLKEYSFRDGYDYENEEESPQELCLTFKNDEGEIKTLTAKADEDYGEGKPNICEVDALKKDLEAVLGGGLLRWGYKEGRETTETGKCSFLVLETTKGEVVFRAESYDSIHCGGYNYGCQGMAWWYAGL